jgi:uncharacterized protein YndB with AHSA1/START domain
VANDESSDAPAAGTRTVCIRRSFPIQRDRLYQLWTDPIHLAQWWGPTGWTVTRCEIDAQAGGRWNTWLLTSGGEARSIGGRYLEIAPPEKLVFTWELKDAEADALLISVVSVLFFERGSETEIVLEHHELLTGQAIDMDVGWSMTFDSLSRHIAASGVATKTPDNLQRRDDQ